MRSREMLRLPHTMPIMATTSPAAATRSADSGVSAAHLRDLIASELPDLINLRHDLHQHPEIGFQERYTSEVIQRELTRAGVKFAPGLAGGTGVLGHLPGSTDRTIGLRADMDALPIEEETGVAYASTTPGVMHACGHDGHTTMLIGAARVLAKLAQSQALPNPVSFVFQPAEEGWGGGRRMVEDGCLDGSKIGTPITAMYGLHGWPMMPLGVVGTRPGPLLAAADNFKVTIRGRGGHAAMPHLNRDPIVAGAAIVQALQAIVSRTVDPLDSAVVSVTMFHGGTATNVIPEEVTLEGTVRTLRKATQTLVRGRMKEVIEHVAIAHGCTGSLEYREGYPVTRNDEHAAATFDRIARATLGEQRVVRVAEPVMGAEDFSYYCEKVPSCFFFLGLQAPGQPPMSPLHHPKFDFNDDAMSTGIEMFVRLALEG